ncbi:potassium channel family protein [Actinotignum sp. GS-2025a]|uniref:potassium channel family protein n=1 Tax=Actinotignum sp. GS-2025a TaxID=3427274 RepID=UPI003F466612
MNILIIGAGAVGVSVARELLKSEHSISIVDKKPSAMRISSASDADWHLADACEVPALREAGAAEADIIVCATGDDKVNLVVSLLAKTEFGIARTIARVNNPRNEWLFTDAWGVDVTVSTPRIMASLVEDAVSDGSLTQVMRFHRSGASLWQVSVSAEAPVVGSAISDIELPAGVAINAIIRDGVPLTADADLIVDVDDQVLLIDGGDDVDMSALKNYFRPRPVAPAQDADGESAADSEGSR